MYIKKNNIYGDKDLNIKKMNIIDFKKNKE